MVEEVASRGPSVSSTEPLPAPESITAVGGEEGGDRKSSEPTKRHWRAGGTPVRELLKGGPNAIPPTSPGTTKSPPIKKAKTGAEADEEELPDFNEHLTEEDRQDEEEQARMQAKHFGMDSPPSLLVAKSKNPAKTTL